MYIDKNNILCVGPELPGKVYTVVVDGYKFSSPDKEIVVYHKKSLKVIHLKNLGNQMAIFYVGEKKKVQACFSSQSFLSGLTLFSGFDEETGETKSFLYKFSPLEVQRKNEELKKLGIDLQIVHLPKGVYIQPFCGKTALDKFEAGHIKDVKDRIEFFCGLSVLYGKPTAKGGTLFSWVWQVPLFGKYLIYQEMFETGIQYLQSQGYFISHSVVHNQQGCVVQMTTRDYELLESLQNLHKPLANYEQISTKKAVIEAFPLVESFLKEQKADEKFLDTIRNSHLKLLLKVR